MKYFSFDPLDLGFEIHDTAEQAKARAKVCIQDYIDCEGFWDDMINQVCWGELTEIAKMTNQRQDETGKHDFMCDFELKPVED